MAKRTSAKRWRHGDVVHKWLRKKNFAIFIFLCLYAAAKTALYIDDHFATFVPRELLVVLSGLPAIFLTLFVSNIIIRIFSPFLSRFFKDELEPEQQVFFAKMFEIFIYGCALAFILYSFGVTTSSLALIVGFISGGIAFGLRDIVLSFIVWVIVLGKKPFRLGDNVRIANYEGRVDRIGTFFLTLSSATRTLDDATFKEHVVKLPNKMLIENPIENYGHRNVTCVLRLQIRKAPKNVDALLKSVENIAADTLRRLELSRPMIEFDIQNTPANDKHYFVITYEVPLSQRDMVRSQLLRALLTKNKAMFLPV